MLKKYFKLMAILVIPSLLFSDAVDNAMNNLADDYAQCSAYYAVASNGMKNLKKENEVKRSLKVAEFMYKLSVQISNEETAMARVQLSIKDHYKTMDNHFKNFSRLILKYGELCKELHEDPKQRLQYWIKKEE